MTSRKEDTNSNLQERYNGEHKNLVNDDSYLPFSSPLTDKSDVWTLGLLAHAMVYAHHDTLTTLGDEREWEKNLPLEEYYERESHFNTSSIRLADLPMVYGAQLCYTIERCLRHDIEARPSLRELLEICQDKLTRMDEMSGSTAGKRKRDDNSEDDTRLVTAGHFTQKFDKFGVGEIYRPKRVRMMANLFDPEEHATYNRIVDERSRMERPTPESQTIIIDALDQHFLDVDDENSLVNEGIQFRWALSHLVSCLRKRCEPKGAAYILTEAYHGKYDDGMNETFKIATKAGVLREIINDTGFWDQARSSGDEGTRVALDALQNAINWGSIMLYNTEVPANDTENQGQIAEPVEPQMEDQSSLHLGIHEWIFIVPRGALHILQY